MPAASTSAVPVVGGVVTGSAAAVAPQVGAVAATASGAVPSAGVAVTAPAATTLPSSASVVKGPDQRTCFRDNDRRDDRKSPAPSAGSSVPAASTSAVPVVGGVVTGSAAAVAPQVGAVAATASGAVPSAGVAVTAPPQPRCRVPPAWSKEPSQRTCCRDNDRRDDRKSPAPSAGSSVPAASSSAVPVVGGVVTGSTAAVAPQVGAVAATASGAVPSAGEISFSEVATFPRSENFTHRVMLLNQVQGG